jgi:hypothetical protein
MAAAGGVEMLFSVTDGKQYHMPRQWALDFIAAKKLKDPSILCNPKPMLE